MIPPDDIVALQAAFAVNPRDLGVGLVHLHDGIIRLGSFDLVTLGQGHRGLADAIGVTRNHRWRGFVVTATGQFVTTRHFLIIHGGLLLRPETAAVVEAELRQAGLLQ